MKVAAKAMVFVFEGVATLRRWFEGKRLWKEQAEALQLAVRG